MRPYITLALPLFPDDSTTSIIIDHIHHLFIENNAQQEAQIVIMFEANKEEQEVGLPPSSTP